MTARRSRSAIIAGVVLLVGFAGLLWLTRSAKDATQTSHALASTDAPTSAHDPPIQTTHPKSAPSATQATLTPTVRAAAVADPTPDPTVKAAVRSFIDIMGGMLEGMGAKRVAPVADRIAHAVESGNWGEIHRTFNEAIYDRFAKMSESIPAIRQYLNHSNPYVRFSAGRALIIAGQRDGIQTMLDLVSAPDPIVIPSGIVGFEGQQELRREAAGVLAKYRIRKAIDPLVELSRDTSLGSLVLRDLARTGLRPHQIDLQFSAGEVSMTIYGLLGLREFVPQLSAVLESAPNTAEYWAKERTYTARVVATWALAELTGNRSHVEKLVTIAQEAVDSRPKGHEPRTYQATALKYLGSVHNPEAVRLLETALASENTLAVKYAVVNLLYNHDGGSGAAREVLIEELRGGRKPLGVTLSRQIAAGLDDPDVHAIAAEADRGSSHRAWRYWGIERKNWPIYNWIDDYVVKLRRDYEGDR